LESHEFFQTLLIQPYLINAVNLLNDDFPAKFEGLKVFSDPGTVGLRDAFYFIIRLKLVILVCYIDIISVCL
jgi:hypothetical protein